MAKTPRDQEKARANRLAVVVKTLLSEHVPLDVRLIAAREQVDALWDDDTGIFCEVRGCPRVAAYLVDHRDGDPITVCASHALHRLDEITREEKKRGRQS